MIGSPFELPQDDNNPLAAFEEIAQEQEWALEPRANEDHLTFTVKGKESSYTIHMEWQDEFAALIFACVIDTDIDARHRIHAVEVLAHVNESLWLGHFDLSTEGVLPTLRHTMLLRGIPPQVSAELMADLTELAVAECDRFFSTFKMLGSGDIRTRDALSAAVFETVGEA